MIDGYVFRASLAVSQEAQLLLQEAEGGEGGREEGERVARKVGRAPTHHRLVQACHASNPLYGRVVRLASIWLSNHLLPPTPVTTISSFSVPPSLSHEALELLVASLFAAPRRPPGSPLAGLLAFLSLLSTHDWRTSPLLVDPHHTLLPSDHEAAIKAFEDHQDRQEGGREGGRPMLYVVAPYDKESGWKPSWTSPSSPEPVVLGRMVALAAASLQQLVAWMEEGGREGGWKPALVPPSPFAAISAAADGMAPSLVMGQQQQFDALIRFKPAWVGPLFSGAYEEGGQAWEEVQKGCKALRCGHLYKNLAGAQAQKRVVGFDPIREYQERLVKRYGGLALFFVAGGEGGWREGVAVVFRPRAFLPSSFAVLQTRGKVPVKVQMEGEGEGGRERGGLPVLLPNIAEVISEFRTLGEGIVDEVVLL